MPNKNGKLTDAEIGDCLDLEIEATYPRSDGSLVSTVSVDKLADAAYQAARERIIALLEKWEKQPPKWKAEYAIAAGRGHLWPYIEALKE